MKNIDNINDYLKFRKNKHSLKELTLSNRTLSSLIFVHQSWTQGFNFLTICKTINYKILDFWRITCGDLMEVKGLETIKRILARINTEIKTINKLTKFIRNYISGRCKGNIITRSLYLDMI